MKVEVGQIWQEKDTKNKIVITKIYPKPLATSPYACSALDKGYNYEYWGRLNNHLEPDGGFASDYIYFGIDPTYIGDSNICTHDCCKKK